MRSILPHTGNPTLRQVAREVPPADIQSTRIQTLITDMKKLLVREDQGVALAAPQVGESLRLFIVAGTAAKKRAAANAERGEKESESIAGMPEEDTVYINPTLKKISRGKKEKHEGCLSIRGKWGIVPRAEKATVRAYDENGKKFTRGASGFLAHIFQHEMDHLEGILYIDKAATLYDEESDAE